MKWRISPHPRPHEVGPVPLPEFDKTLRWLVATEIKLAGVVSKGGGRFFGGSGGMDNRKGGGGDRTTISTRFTDAVTSDGGGTCVQYRGRRNASTWTGSATANSSTLTPMGRWPTTARRRRRSFNNTNVEPAARRSGEGMGMTARVGQSDTKVRASRGRGTSSGGRVNQGRAIRVLKSSIWQAAWRRVGETPSSSACSIGEG